MLCAVGLVQCSKLLSGQCWWAYCSPGRSGKPWLVAVWGDACIMCMYAFVWVRVYFPLNPISQVSSTSAIACLARLLFLVSHFYSGLGKLTTFFLILCSALFSGSYMYIHRWTLPIMSGSGIWIFAIFCPWFHPRYTASRQFCCPVPVPTLPESNVSWSKGRLVDFKGQNHRSQN